MVILKFSVLDLGWLAIFWGLFRLARAYNYCNNETHECNIHHMKHFICRLDEELQPLLYKAEYVGIVPTTPELRDLILEYHNKYRDMLASGELVTNNNESFQPASRMRELIWDPELAYTARVHASTVSFKHSICRSVLRFPYVGENMGLIFASTERRRLRDLIELTLTRMFEEYRLADDPEELNHEFDGSKHHNVAHFALMVNDRVSRVGCAFVVAQNCEESDKPGYCHFLTCHYDFTNFAESYTYWAGWSATQCSVWGTTVSDEYENLCTNNGVIFNPYHAHGFYNIDADDDEVEGEGEVENEEVETRKRF